jgi:hypothetical protein
MDGTGSGLASVISFVISASVSLESAVLASFISLHENKSRFYWKIHKTCLAFQASVYAEGSKNHKL